MERGTILEAIDVMGHISFYSDDTTSLSILLELFHGNRDDEVLIWKVLRALSAFGASEVGELLEEVREGSSVAAHVWEAERSLGLLK